MRDRRYLAVPDSARKALEPYGPVYGEVLDDGRAVCKVRVAIARLPDGVTLIGDDPREVRKLVYAPTVDQRFKARPTVGLEAVTEVRR